MNFDDAIQARAGWKIKLADYLKHPGGTIKSGEVGADNRCLRGQWLRGEAKKKYSSLPEYQTDTTPFHPSRQDPLELAAPHGVNSPQLR